MSFVKKTPSEVIELLAKHSSVNGSYQTAFSEMIHPRHICEFIIENEKERLAPVEDPQYLALVLYLASREKYLFKQLEYYREYEDMAQDCIDIYRQVVVTKSNYLKYGPTVVSASVIATKECYELEGFVDDVLKCDRCPLLPYDYETITKVLDRVNYLKDELPDLWSNNLHSYYREYLNPVVSLMLGSTISSELMFRVLDTLEDDHHVKELVNKYGDNFRAVDLCNPESAAHALGLPVYNMDMSLETIIQKVIEVQKDPEAHIQSIVDINRDNLETFRKRISSITGKEVKVYNEEDCCGELVENFHPDQIYRYAEEGFIYQFTPQEFETLFEKGENFWNRNPIPQVQLSVLKRLRKNYECFPCETIPDLIKGLDERYELKDAIYNLHNLPTYTIFTERKPDDLKPVPLPSDDDDELPGVSPDEDDDELPWIRINLDEESSEASRSEVAQTIFRLFGEVNTSDALIVFDEKRTYLSIASRIHNLICRVDLVQHPSIIRTFADLASNPIGMHVALVQLRPETENVANLQNYILGLDGKTAILNVQNHSELTRLQINDERIVRNNSAIHTAHELLYKLGQALDTTRFANLAPENPNYLTIRSKLSQIANDLDIASHRYRNVQIRIFELLKRPANFCLALTHLETDDDRRNTILEILGIERVKVIVPDGESLEVAPTDPLIVPDQLTMTEVKGILESIDTSSSEPVVRHATVQEIVNRLNIVESEQDKIYTMILPWVVMEITRFRAGLTSIVAHRRTAQIRDTILDVVHRYPETGQVDEEITNDIKTLLTEIARAQSPRSPTLVEMIMDHLGVGESNYSAIHDKFTALMSDLPKFRSMLLVLVISNSRCTEEAQHILILIGMDNYTRDNVDVSEVRELEEFLVQITNN